MTRFGRHAPEIRIQSGAESEPAAPNRTDECARFVERQRGDITAKIVPDAVLLQVLLDVRKIERDNLAVVFPDVFPDRTYGLWSGEITYDGHEHVFCFECFQDREVLFTGQIAAKHALGISSGHQIFVGHAAEATSAARSIIDARAKPVEIVVDVFDPFKIVFGKWKAMRFRKMVLNSFEIFRVERIAGESFTVCREDILDTGLRSKSFRPFARKQQRDEISSILRQFKQRFIHELKFEISAADVEDERHSRFERCNVGEVLFGSYTHINAIF